MGKNQIKLNESQIIDVIKESVNRILFEWDWDDDYQGEVGSAQDDFSRWGFEEDVRNRYPDMEFDFQVDDNTGEVTITDLNSGKYYTVSGEIEYDDVPAGYPSANDRDIEATETRGFWSFTCALNELISKIDGDKPDGIDNEYIDTDDETLADAVSEAVKQYLRGRKFV